MKLVYSVPITVRDSLGKPVSDPEVLGALSGMSCPDRVVQVPGRDDLEGGHLRLARDGKRLRLRAEFDVPRGLSRVELAALRKELQEPVTAELTEGAFDFLVEAAGLSVETAAGGGTVEQFPGEAWSPARPSAEAGANKRRCRAAADALRASGRSGAGSTG